MPIVRGAENGGSSQVKMAELPKEGILAGSAFCFDRYKLKGGK
jgi:hypothetical protein